MSGGNESYADTAIQHGGLEPPRSLHGVEDAAVIWDTIARRFPNAAPLLCEMETVIERAEDLLQQLRTQTCTESNDTSSSFHTPDSRESNATISMVSDIESFAEETNVPRHPEEEIETQLDTKQADPPTLQQRSERSVQCEMKYPGDEYQTTTVPTSRRRRLDEVVQHFETRTTTTDGRQVSQGESAADVAITDGGDKGCDLGPGERLIEADVMTERSSLEGWAKVADDALREWQDDDVGNVVDASDDNSAEDARLNVDENNRENRLSTMDDGRCDETSHESCRSSDTRVIRYNSQESSAKNSTIAETSRRTPLAILEEYARRCKVSIKYEYKPKPNLCVINGDLCGFRETQDLAKNELAAKILGMVAERQMDGSKLSSSFCGLSDLTREELLGVIAFNKGELKNASQKVYKFCLERGAPVPEYSIRNLRTNVGFMYTAQCVALGYVGVGQGLRRDSAKIAAAENLYQRYIHETEQRAI